MKVKNKVTNKDCEKLFNELLAYANKNNMGNVFAPSDVSLIKKEMSNLVKEEEQETAHYRLFNALLSLKKGNEKAARAEITQLSANYLLRKANENFLKAGKIRIPKEKQRLEERGKTLMNMYWEKVNNAKLTTSKIKGQSILEHFNFHIPGEIKKVKKTNKKRRRRR